MLSRFHLIPERYGQTDGQTDRFAISIISHVSMLTRNKKTNSMMTPPGLQISLWHHVTLTFDLVATQLAFTVG